MVTDALDLAEYFDKKMVETLKIPSEFRANTNAFVTSGRNITWALQKQFSKNAKFRTWYAQKQNEMKNDELMTFFNEARKISVKEHPLRPARSTYFRRIDLNTPKAGTEKTGFAITGEGEAVWVTKDKDGKEKRIHASEFDNESVVQYYFETPIPPRTFEELQVIDLCGLYLFALKDLVKEALEIGRE